jgi:hypothetical protein
MIMLSFPGDQINSLELVILKVFDMKDHCNIRWPLSLGRVISGLNTILQMCYKN